MFDMFPDNPLVNDYVITLREQLQQTRVYDYCHAFVIDGNMGIELKLYFNETHDGNQSVQCHLFHLGIGY